MSSIARRAFGPLALSFTILAASFLPASAASSAATPSFPPQAEEDQCEPKTTHHEVHDADGVLIGIQVVATRRDCTTVTAFIPIGEPPPAGGD
jgi:hypothetical protein